MGIMNGQSAHESGEFDFDFDRNPTWRIFRIMSEFVDGFSFLSTIPKSVTIFGSARLSEDHPFYQKARDLGSRLAGRGYAVVTGGGPGLMQAANEGAHDAGGNSIGLNIQLPHEQRMNPFVTHSMSFNYFFSRKVMLDFSAEAYIFFPGGFGTLDEFFEVITLIQSGKIERNVPVILVGEEFWSPLIDWMKSAMLDRLHTIDATDLTIWTLTDDLDDIERIIETGVQRESAEWLAKQGRPRKTASDKLKQATMPMKRTEQ